MGIFLSWADLAHSEVSFWGACWVIRGWVWELSLAGLIWPIVLAMFVRSHRSLHSLALQRFAMLCLFCSIAPFIGSLAHFAHSHI